jgi:hypothetical protein
MRSFAKIANFDTSVNGGIWLHELGLVQDAYDQSSCCFWSVHKLLTLLLLNEANCKINKFAPFGQNGSMVIA